MIRRIGRQRRGTLPHRCLEYVTQWSSNFENFLIYKLGQVWWDMIEHNQTICRRLERSFLFLFSKRDGLILEYLFRSKLKTVPTYRLLFNQQYIE
jgi:hypothetical protein